MPKKYSGVMIIDDDDSVSKAFCRSAKGRMDCVLFPVKTPQHAVAKLDLMNGLISHIVCEQNLGAGDLKGDLLLPILRRNYKGIKRGVIWTSSDVGQVQKQEGIDAVVKKGSALESLFAALEI